MSVVTFDVGPLVQNYVANAEWDWPLLIDSDRELYRHYSMGRGGWWSIYGPASIWNYIALMAKGRTPGKPGSDFRQFGGDILVDPKGIVRYHHVSTSPHDRPEVDEILALAETE